MAQNIVTIKRISFPTKRQPKFTALVVFEGAPDLSHNVIWKRLPVSLTVIDPLTSEDKP